MLDLDSMIGGLAGPDFMYDDAALQAARRLIQASETAARRFSDDPEILTLLGDARFHFGHEFGISPELALEGFEQAIQFDSAFGPAYLHAIELALYYRGAAAARRHAAAMVALDPTGSDRMHATAILRLLGSERTSDVLRDLEAALPPDVLFGLVDVFKRLADRDELAANIVRQDLRVEGLPWPSPEELREMRVGVLAYRGHLREAIRSEDPDRPSRVLMFAASHGIVPREPSTVRTRRWLAGRHPKSGVAMPWWAATRDTAALLEFARWKDSLVIAGGPSGSGRHRHESATARAFVDLAFGDTLGALRRIDSVADSACPSCYEGRLAFARLLTMRGCADQARGILDGEAWQVEAPPAPQEVLWILERARAAAQTGDRKAAVEAYRRVTEVWRRADPELQGYVKEAQREVRRLDSRFPRSGFITKQSPGRRC